MQTDRIHSRACELGVNGAVSHGQRQRENGA